MDGREPADPSRATRAELTLRATEGVSALGGLAKFVGKAATSPALASTITAFTDCEVTIDSTESMLRKIRQGMLDLDEMVEEALSPVPMAPREGAAASQVQSRNEYQ